MGHYLHHGYTTYFVIAEYKDGTDYGKKTLTWINEQGDFTIAENFMETSISQDLGIFIDRRGEGVPLDHAFYRLTGPTDNLWEDGKNGLIEIAPHRATDYNFMQWICREDKEPVNDPNEFCATYFASLNN